MSIKIVEENKLQGAPSTEWDINGWGDPSIQGFAHDISVNLGETVYFRVKTDSADYRLDIYRMGYYGGMGARLVDTVRPAVPLPQSQPDGHFEPETKLYDFGNWAVSATWDVPANGVSGIYFARLIRHDSPEPEKRPAYPHAYGDAGYGDFALAMREPNASHIYFVVRDDASHSDIIFQTADTTWQAYNRYGGEHGGYCTYAEFNPDYPRGHGHKADRAYKVSYNRPFETRHYRAVNMPFNAEYPFVRWLERNGYDVTYTTGVDSDRRGELILNHNLFMSVAHDEYWSADQRKHVETARDAGVNLAFFSGNEVFWKIRWEEDIVGDGVARRTMVVYKETHANAKIDPLPDVWTGTWRDDREFNPEGPQPENALTGTIFTVNAWRNDPLVVPHEYSHLRFWRNSPVAQLKPGERAVLLKGLLGHEWDQDLDNGYRPAGLFRLSETTVHNVWYVQDQGTDFQAGSATHHLTLYRAASGALVFGAGTIQWSWGLDGHHDTDTGVPPERATKTSTRVGTDLHAPDRAIQQATVNLFADMGIQPSSLEDGLVRGEISADLTPPVSQITEPQHGATLAAGEITIRGTATDADGAVGGVEISIDGGNRWHPATGRESWRYRWQASAGIHTLLCRAVDDSANLESASAAITVTII